MRFPEKLDVLTVHATLIAETGGTVGLRDEALLETNGFELTMTNEELVDLFLAIAASKLSREQVDQRLRERVTQKS